MAKRAATVAFPVVLLALVGCGPAQPVSSPPSTLSDAAPNEVSAGHIDEAISTVDGLVGLYAKGFGVRDVSDSDKP